MECSLRRFRRTLPLVSLACWLASPMAMAAEPQADRGGVAATDAAGKSLNLDFEAGTLDGWTADGEAFAKQPVHGDAVAARRSDMQSQHAGEYWVGSFEVGGDAPQGTLSSAPFAVAAPYCSFLIGGGSSPATCVELVLQDGGQVIARVTGQDTENLSPVAVDLTKHVGQQIFVRLVDRQSGGWGHINFDDFRFHAEKPDLPARSIATAIDIYAHAGLNPADAAAAMTVPAGFKVSLFAGEPDVQQPISLAIDDRGRLWVAEAYGYPLRQPEGEGKDRILIFEDTNGDGAFDTRKVFMDKLNLVSGLELGFGGVWVGSAPQFLFIPDANGDDTPDGPPQVLLDGWGYQDTHETLNSFMWGPDGWLYGCHGVFTHSRVGKPGTPDNERVPINAGIWRYHPTKHQFEVFAEGTSNPWGVDFNDQGQCFITACVIPHLYHMVQNGRYLRQAGQHFNPYTYSDIDTIALHRHWIGATPHSGNNRSDVAGGGHAHSGAMFYLGGVWPDEYREKLFMNNIHGARLNVDQIARRGSGYVGDRSPDFLFANDSWSQLLYFTYGQDGQVYMIDWYDANQCHHGDVPGHDRSNGRIFKISYGDAKPAPAVDLKSLPSGELVEHLANKNEYFARHARRILQERGSNPRVQQALTEVAFGEGEERVRLRALWALQAIGGLNDRLLVRGLHNVGEYFRAWCIQFAAEGGSVSPAIQKELLALAATDSFPVVRLYLASAAIRLPVDSGKELVGRLLTHGEDANDHNLPLLYWYAAERVAANDPAQGMKYLAQTKIPLVRNYLIRRLTQLRDDTILDSLISNTLAAKAVNPDDDATVLEALRQGLAGRRQVAMPKAWSAAYARLTKSDNADVRSAAAALALLFGDAKQLGAQREVLLSDSASGEERAAALQALVNVRADGLAKDLQGLINNPALAEAALRALASYDDPNTPGVVLRAYSGLSQNAKRAALNTLSGRADYAVALLDAVAKQEVPATDFSAEILRQLRSHEDQRVQDAIAKIWGALRDTPEDKAELIEHLKDLLTSAPSSAGIADPFLGRAMFDKTCKQCHTLFGTGAKVGPELTGSNRADLDYLLSNMVDPSAVIGKAYQVQVFALADGRIINGIVTNEDDNNVTVVNADATLVIPKEDIEDRAMSEKSMMPDDLLSQLGEREVRSLVAYLAAPAQVPAAATPETASAIFNGKDLTGWTGDTSVWSVEDGEIVGRTEGLEHNTFLVSEIAPADFRLSLEMKLTPNEANSGVQIRSKALPDGEMLGYQADAGAGWWGKLYEESGRALLWDKPGEQHVKPNEWNKYEIVAVGSRVRTWINGQLCVDLDDPQGARRGVIGLQVHSGGKTEARFRNLKLELLDPPHGEYVPGKPLGPAGEARTGEIKFKKTTIEEKFRSEGVAMGDFNNDGLIDIAAGSVWYEAPEWKMHPLLEKANEFDKKTYGDTFCNWAEDLNNDGRQDLIVVDFPGKQTWWFENPGSTGGVWARHEIVPVTGNESPQYLDINGDGRRELIYGDGNQQLCVASPAEDPTAPWNVRVISLPNAPGTQQFSHGLGLGDVNRDGRTDIVVPEGWWSAPEESTDAPWVMHSAPLGEAQAHMYIFDFDGDGDQDVAGSSAHRRGVWWHEQTPEGWKTHEIDSSIAQTHAMCFVDMSGDGLPDLVTGKRYYAHNGNDPGEDEPALLAWYELSRENGKPNWRQHVVDRDSGVGTHFEVYDMNRDGLLDIIVANKRGVFYFEQSRE
ncbi:MAG: PVC-type heme-binding CxxCH protein [Planctomycetia bacterium]|nr:PVC-type heme-binding CxxCH protein [Planctomycetia bacterium]